MRHMHRQFYVEWIQLLMNYKKHFLRFYQWKNVDVTVFSRWHHFLGNWKRSLYDFESETNKRFSGIECPIYLMYFLNISSVLEERKDETDDEKGSFNCFSFHFDRLFVLPFLLLAPSSLYILSSVTIFFHFFSHFDFASFGKIFFFGRTCHFWTIARLQFY